MATLKLRKGHIAVIPDMHEYQKCRSLYGGQYFKEYKEFRFPHSALMTLVSNFYGINSEYQVEHAVKKKEMPELVLKVLQTNKRRDAEVSELKKVGAKELHNKGHLFNHQQLCREIANAQPRYGLFCEAGTGKTLIGLQIISDDLEQNPNRRWLIVCPLPLISTAWINDGKQFYPHLNIVNLHGNTPAQTKKAYGTLANIYIVNYESFRAKYDDVMKLGPFDGAIIDESSKMKSASSKITKALLKFSMTVERWYALSGTPAPNSMLEYFSQMQAIDAALLGTNFSAFKARWFYQLPNNSFIINDKNRQDLTNLLEKRAIFIPKEACLDLPEKLPPRVYSIEMPKELRKMYNEMRRKLRTQVPTGEMVVTKTSLTMLQKLNQLTSGILLDSGTVHRVSTAKLQVLEDILEDIGSKQVIIWANYHGEFDMLREMLKDRCVTFYGETNRAEIEPLVDKYYGAGMFKQLYDEGASVKDLAARLFKDGKVQYLIANPASAGHGLTFTNCSYAVYYSLNYSYEQWSQSQDRMHRIGQRNPCTYIVISMENSIDEVIYGVLQQKGNMAHAVLNHLQAEVMR